MHLRGCFPALNCRLTSPENVSSSTMTAVGPVQYTEPLPRGENAMQQVPLHTKQKKEILFMHCQHQSSNLAWVPLPLRRNKLSGFWPWTSSHSCDITPTKQIACLLRQLRSLFTSTRWLYLKTTTFILKLYMERLQN